MPSESRRNPEFTTDEIRTATLLVTEGTSTCVPARGKYPKTHYYPRLEIRMCDKEALKPAEKVLGTQITKQKTTKFECPPHLYPPDGKGIWLLQKQEKAPNKSFNA